jgi:hypothetical protein
LNKARKSSTDPAAVLDLHKRNQEAEAIKLFNEQLTPAWTAGRMKLNDIIRATRRWRTRTWRPSTTQC